MEEIRFSGLTTSPAGPGKMPPFKKKEGISNWFDIVEQAYFQLTKTDEGKKSYGDPEKGATLEQIWRVVGMISGKRPVCLLASGRPDVPVGEIERLVRVNPHQLVDTMKVILGYSDNIAIQILYFDGSTGHSISLLGYDESDSRFTYHDPWPDFSLLSKEYNLAGIDAQRLDRQIWTMRDEELERVVFAALIPKFIWATFSGEKYSILFSDLHQTDFWNFFNIKIINTQENEDGFLYGLKTGGFQSEIDLAIKTNLAGALRDCNLYINRNWLLGPPYGINPFGLDIIRSFIGATLSPSDITRIENILKLFEIGKVQAYLQMFREQKDEGSIYSEIMKVYFGLLENYHLPFDYSDILFKNIVSENTERLMINTKIDTIN